MSKITKVFKKIIPKIIPKKKKVAAVAAVVKAAPIAATKVASGAAKVASGATKVASGVAKKGVDLAANVRTKAAARVRLKSGLGTTDDTAIIRPGARSAKLLGD